MKLNFKKTVAIAICFCFIFTFNFSKIYAATDKNDFKVITNNDEESTVMAEKDGNQLYATLDKKTNRITMYSIEKAKNKIMGFAIGSDKRNDYDVKVENNVDGKMSAVVTDLKSNKQFKLAKDSDKVNAQAPIAVPLVEILGAAVVQYLLYISAAIVVGGITYYAATKVIENIRKGNYDYYAAYTVPGKDVYIAGAIDYTTAVGRLCSGNGNDVFSKLRSKAYLVAFAAGGSRTPVGIELGSGDGKQYPHYHVYDRWYGTHSFFATFD